MKKNILFVLAFLSGGISLAQDQPIGCVSDESLEERIEKHPEVKELEEFTEEFTKNFEKGIGRKANETYIIPTVFHIIHQNNDAKISKDQVEDAVRIINREFNAQNNGYSTVDSRFSSLRADVGIEVRLAKIDPSGQSTTGVDYVYSSACGRDVSQLKDHAWDNKRYLNIFIVSDPEGRSNGTCYTNSNSSGWAFLPSNQPAGESMIVYNHRFTGSIGTANGWTEGSIISTLTHEIGHWLNLHHIWASGDVAKENACSYDDYVDDTPNTKGRDGCYGVTYTCESYDNIENFMDYTGNCNKYKMFTKGQKARMIACLNSTVGNRKNIVSEQNLISTGVKVGTIAPKVDFEVSAKLVAPGATVRFYDRSLYEPTEWQWALFTTLNDRELKTVKNPTITYTELGPKRAYLKVTNSVGTTNTDRYGVVRVENGIAPTNESFESFLPDNWEIINPDRDNFTWESGDRGSNGTSKAIVMNNADNAVLGRIDEIMTPVYDFRGISSSSLSFDYAYTKFNDASPDRLKVYYSVDYGESSNKTGDVRWVELVNKDHNALETKNVSQAESNDWKPTSADWETETVNINAVNGYNGVRFKFTNVSGYGTRIWVDELKFQFEKSSVGVTDFESLGSMAKIYPNPGSNLLKIDIETLQASTAKISLLNQLGQTLLQKEAVLSAGENKLNLNTQNLNSGIYIVKIETEKGTKLLKWIKK